MTMRRLIASLMLAFSLLGVGGLGVPAASAQVQTGLQEVGETIKLPETDPRVIAVRIINVALGLLGIILVALILYAGFLYMTSGGEAEKTTKAKQIILNAIIGLIIILSAWAITRYVIEALLTATQEQGGVSGGGGGGLGGGLGGTGGAEAFRVKSITPAGSVPLRNVEVKIIFNKSVDEGSAAAIIITKVGGTTVGGTIKADGSIVTFTPAAACPAPNQDRKCFDGDSDFTVKVGGSVRSTQGQTVVCGGFGSSCDGTFHTGNLVDTQPPSVTMSYPVNGQSVQVNFLQDVQADASDDSGIGAVEFFDGATSIDVDAPTVSTTPKQFSAKGAWDTAGAVLGTHTLSAKASDIDSNSTQSASISVVVRPEHCFNSQMDAPSETGIDCGGDPNSQDFCGACSGGSCVQNSDCSSGFCVNGSCVDKPVIRSVAPLNGRPGTFVTLKGVNFGYQTGVVTFLGAAGAQDDKVALAPQVCVSLGAQTWSNTQALVAVPEGAASGPIEIKNGSSGLTDGTSDTNGPPIPNFLVDNTAHPGLCAIQPNSGSVGNQVDAVGEGFGGSAQKITFGILELSAPFPLWSETKVQFQVPVVNSAPYAVSVKTGTGESNPVNFTVVDRSASAMPELQSLDPAEGPQQSYLTLFGKNFGYSVGVVIFTDGNAQEAIGDTSFPSACGSGFWRDDRIVVKVPSAFKNNSATQDGAYQVKIQRPDLKTSNALGFTINSQLPLLPGICAVQPALGPVGTPVEIFGERFGLTPPTVTFFQNKLAAVDSNTSQSVKTGVPAGALTGALQLKAQNQDSNKVNFEVRNCNEAPGLCAPNTEECCATGVCSLKGTCGAKPLAAEYAWQTSTGLIPVAPRVIEECRPDLAPSPTPSPSPWLGRTGGDQAPIDSAVLMRFTTLLDPTTVTVNAFHLYACKGAGSDPCATTQPTTFSVVRIIENNNQQVVKLTPSTTFTTSTTYLVTVASTIKSTGSAAMTMDIMTSCGTGPGNETYGYCFRFKTRASTDPSQIGAVNVIPSPYTMHGSGETAPYEAVPLYAADKCVVLDCQRFDWDWHTGAAPNNQDSRATIGNIKVNGKGLCDQEGTGLVETGQAPVDMVANLVQSTPLKGVGKLFVNFVPPRVEEYFPNCDQACLNGYIWARFSSELDLTSVTTPGNAIVRKCYNENCVESELSPPLSFNPGSVDLVPPFGSQGDKPRVLRINATVTGPAGVLFLLEPGAFYHVLLKGGPNVQNGIIGKNQVPITGLNHPQGFFWTFRVKLGTDAFCKADRVDVVPLEKFETSVNARQLFTATPFGKPDACSASGQALIPTTDATWASSDVAVANLYKINNALIDTGGKLPAGCTGNCRATGAVAVYGRVAVCGNGIIETTDTDYCDAQSQKTPKGDACTVMPAGAKAGEECEPSIDGSSCSASTCLWVPVPLVSLGGSCGNATVNVDKGEACDFGPTCIGGSSATSSPSVNENTPCSAPAAKTACIAAGGDCSMHPYRGCSANCRHLGSVAGKSTCGISDPLGDGKDCDDGNQTDGDGCSSMCLHEGSQAGSVLTSVCGNAILEPGETCEKPNVNVNFPSGCDTATCLHTGKLTCSSPNDTQCCGNGKIETGEDCDDTNQASKDGCSASCLFEGSSVAYSTGLAPAPSFCGNGFIERGEQCEVGASSAQVVGFINSTNPPSVANAQGKGSGKGDMLVDPIQLAFIVGNGTPDPVTGKMSTDINVNVESQDGKAVYGLQCGFTDEASCQPGFGLDSNGCCAERPKVSNAYPPQNSLEVCRNVQIKAVFNVPMNPSLTTNNFEISQLTLKSSCPSGTQELLVGPTYGPGWWGRVKKTWHSVVAWFQGGPVYAQKWCKGAVTGQLTGSGSASSTTAFHFTLDHALEPNTTYRVRFIGDNSTSGDPLSDNADKTLRWGIQSVRGVVHAFESEPGELVWTFETGTGVCGVNLVTIADTTPAPEFPEAAHPFLFLNKNNQSEHRTFESTAQSIQNGAAVPLSPVPEYGWAWSEWTSSDETVVTVTSDPLQNISSDPAGADSLQKNGNSILTSQLYITTDTVNFPSTTGTVVEGVAPVSVLVCENPWPSLAASPFQDRADGPGYTNLNLQFGPFSGLGPNGYFNFSTMYCRDALKPDNALDDMPALNIHQVPKTALDEQNGILRQYLFSYPGPEDVNTLAEYRGLQQDGIGIRIVSNPQHLSPLEWYRSRGFTGKPKDVLVDGYPAIQEGTTVYVAAANRPLGGSGKIYSNIYLISHNPDAKQTTLKIYDQMVKYLAFNINLQNQTNACVDNAQQGKLFSTKVVNDGSPIKCTADWECLPFGVTSLYCDSLKHKLIRDTRRLADFQDIVIALESSKTPQGTYPKAEGGTFLRNWTTSLWTSWTTELGTALGKAPPKDPVNRFLTCGRCSVTNTPCQSTNDCATVQNQSNQCKGGRIVGGAWTFDDKVNPQSCWDQDDHQYVCPNIAQPYGVSRVYQYRSLLAGTRYDLGAEFEVPPGNLNDWWSPRLPDGVYRCVTTSTAGTYCAGQNGQADDYLCRSCPNAENGKCTTCSSGQKAGKSCTPLTANVDCGAGIACSDTTPVIVGACRQFGGTFSYNNICQNVPQGDKDICGDGVLYTDPNVPQNSETCEIGMTQTAACTAQGNQPGHKQQVCDAKTCQGYVDDIQHPQCIANVSCGNGHIDKGCNGNPNAPCETDVNCPNAQLCTTLETCDDGVQNGSYGKCNTSCTGYAGYCGDSQLSPGEICDNGAQNGEYNGTCSLDCKGVGPRCGDTVTDGPPEQCDGNSDATKSKICSAPLVVAGKKTCETDTDCGTGGACGNTQSTQSCVGVTVTVNNVAYDTQHTRTCNTPGNPAQECRWPDWSQCQAIGSCGDGIKDSNEACDDGAGNGDTKACTLLCTQNVCGDGKVYQGVEDCDAASQNGQVTCNADYDSMCLSCSTSCKFQATAGGYCGDKTKNGPEQCDGTTSADVTTNVSCPLVISQNLSQLCPIVASKCTTTSCGKTTETGITCQSLGFDYSKKRRQPSIKGPDQPTIANSELPWIKNGEPTGVPGTNTTCPLDSLPWYQRYIYNKCAGVACQSDPQGTGNILTISRNPKPTIDEFWQCAVDQGGPVGITVDTIDSRVGCSASCGFENCARCSDEPGTAVMEGRVFDALFGQVVPDARVSLLYKGVKVDEAFTDNDGYYKIATMNARNECTSYKVVIDMYQDNICTGSSTRPTDGSGCYGGLTPAWTYPFDLDESLQGGYFPYTSDSFSAQNYRQVFGVPQTETIANLYIFPRPENGKAYSAVTWNTVVGNGVDSNGKNTPIYRNLHVILPKQDAFTVVNFKEGEASSACTYPGPTGGNPSRECARDVHWNAIGSWDINNQLPHARAICIHHAGEVSTGYFSNAYNGCPSEGTQACLENHKTDGVLDNVGVGKQTVQSCKLVSNALNQICKDCGATSDKTCSVTGDWENCWQLSYSPVATLVNYAAMSGSEKVKMYFASTYDTSAAFSAAIKKTSFGYTGYVAITNGSGEATLYKINPPTTGTGYVWYLGDVDASNGTFEKQNAFLGADSNEYVPPTKPAEGFACYRYAYQCPGWGAYCVSDTDNKVIRGTPKAQLCAGSGATSCTQAAGFSCIPLDIPTYSKYNW